MSLSLYSCNNEYKGKVILYNSNQYFEKINSFEISIEKASIIASENYFKNFQDSSEYKFTLDMILDDYYIFTSPRIYNPKTTEYLLSGIWVNGKTGVCLDKKTDEYIKVLMPTPSTELTSYSGKINKK